MNNKHLSWYKEININFIIASRAYFLQCYDVYRTWSVPYHVPVKGYKRDPGMDHWTAVKNILKYLKRTKDMFHVYGGDKELVVNGYVDSSFDTDPDDSE